MKSSISPSLTSHFVLGASNFSENPDLKLDEEGRGALYVMHSYVVPSLPKLVDGKNLIELWQGRERQFGYSYFAFYQKDESNQMVSIITGVINRSNTMQILNTATDPHFRRQGVIENCFYSLVTNPDFPNYVQRIDGSLNTCVNKAPHKDLTEEEKEIYKNEQRKILAEINQYLGEFGLDVITSGNLNEEQKKSHELLSEKAQEVLGEIRRSDLWQKVSFTMVQKVFAGFPEKNFEFVLGAPSGNINLAPSSMANEQLKNYCEGKLAQRRITYLDLESKKEEEKEKDDEEIKPTSMRPSSATQLQTEQNALGHPK